MSLRNHYLRTQHLELSIRSGRLNPTSHQINKGDTMKNYMFVQNTKCEYFPCHKGIPEDQFNCLFCFCPLYMLKNQCGGHFEKKNNIKDCTNCTLPHAPGGYAYILSKMDDVIKKGSDF